MQKQSIALLLDQYSKYFKFKNVAKLKSNVIQKNIFTHIFEGVLLISPITQHILLPKAKNNYQLQTGCKPIQLDQEDNALYQFYIQSEQFNKHKIPIKQRKKRKYEMDEQENKRRVKAYLWKMKIWNQQKQQLQSKKLKQLQKKEKQQKIQQQTKLLEQKKNQQKLKLEKQKKIQEGLQNIQDRKKKRQQMIRESVIRKNQSLQSLDKVPKYIKLEQAYLQKQRKKIQDAQTQNKIRREQLLRQQNQIKAHEKAYIQKLKKKLGTKTKDQSPPSTQRKVKSDFVKFLKKDQIQLQKSKQKVTRIKQFQQKIRSIPITINTQKRKEIQIKIDKHKNSRKYTILQGKALNDDQIFNEFHNFDIDVDPKAVGNKYLEQLKVLPKKSRINKSNSISTMPPISEKPTYRNYLQDIRLKKKSVDTPFKSEEQIIHQVLQKSKKKGNYNQKKQQVEKKITEKIAEYERTVMQKVNQMKNMTRYDDSLRKQSQIDQLYAKLMNSKLVSINLD